VGRFYRHDSPYTYFTPDEQHPGEISLECSRAGAAAGALWLTLQCLPLKAQTGLGPVLAACLHAAQRFAKRIEEAGTFALHVPPQLDIVTFFPEGPWQSASALDRASERVFSQAMASRDRPVFLSLLKVTASRLRCCYPTLSADLATCRILRSTLMKPEHEGWAVQLHDSLQATVQRELTRPGAHVS
jgi:hypothetical protein